MHLSPPVEAGFSQGMAFRDLVERTADVVIVTGAELDRPGPVIRYVNPAFTRLTGWEPHEVIGRSPRILQGPGTDREAAAAIGEQLRAGKRVETRLLNYARSGTPYWIDLRIVPLFDPRGRIDGFAAFQRDVTGEMRRPDAPAGADAVSPEGRRAGAADPATLRAKGMCAAWVSVEEFGRIRGEHGHLAAEAVMQGVADLLRAKLRRGDVVARMGGAEIAAAMPGITLAEARGVAERLRRALCAAEYPTEAGAFRIGCTFGLAAARPEETLTAMLARAHAAVQAARYTGQTVAAAA